MSIKIRQPAVAGLFYSSQKETLQREVAMYLENSPSLDDIQTIFGLVAPHAGYMYSGGVAARAYRQIVDREYEVVVVISPSHRVYFEEVSVYHGKAYSTPLGEIPVDTELAQAIAGEDSRLIYSGIGHDIDEHALEVQLPFLQHTLEDFKLIPIVMGDQNDENVQALSDALAKHLKGRKALIVASSDLSHYYSYDKAVLLDGVVVEDINNFDDKKLAHDLKNGVCEMCGGGPVLATMKACRALGASKSKVILYRNSGDVTGDRSQVVGYLAALFYS
ncbi:MAG TPA: AmmeMemoRadiSam system protein B [Caldithrix abyssi]|uniref:MEMO1 family protein ENJ89_04720 n=1 Tax=Caldithrix abyssi TaxID=187145 RepID=A0A7V5PPP0_CALAY|nr:AmmeMemoRadiSam system protein B [Caldithrix abyssi]